MKRIAGLLALGLLSACVKAEEPKPATELPGKEVDYVCATGGRLTVTYGAGKVTLDGPETLIQEGASQRWSWPSDGTHHIWEKAPDGQGTLSLSTAGVVTVEKSGCLPKA